MKERQLSPARLARTLGLVVAAATLGAFGDVASPASAATADSLSYTSVEGALVHGPVTLRARTWGPVREVRFAIDGPAHRYWVDRSAPFYINGGPGNLWDTTTVPDGAYRLTMTIVRRSGRSVRKVERFRIDNDSHADPAVSTRAPAPAAIPPPAPSPGSTSGTGPGIMTGLGRGSINVTGAMTGLGTLDTVCVDLGGGDYSVTLNSDSPAVHIVLWKGASSSPLSGTITPAAASIVDGSHLAVATRAGGGGDFRGDIVDETGRTYSVGGSFTCS